MATLVGVIVDVSGSMERSVGDTRHRHGGEWVRSIFHVVDDLIIKHDVSSKNHVFALGCGARQEPIVFDLLNAIEKSKQPSVSAGLTHHQTLERILSILEENGAPTVRRWGKMHVLIKHIDESDAKTFLDFLSHDKRFRRRFVHDCLPKECRCFDLYSKGAYIATTTLGSMADFVFGSKFRERVEEHATADIVKDVVKKGMDIVKEIDETAVIDVKKAHEILHGCIAEDDLTNQRVDELMDSVRPYLYGGTPLMETLEITKKLFTISRYKNHTKLLFILSDGNPTDGGYPPVLSHLGVTSVCCYITNDSIQDPKRLYSREDDSWDAAAKFMFRMSSSITTQRIPRTIFVKRQWKIDIENNETRLFVQANHPDIVQDVCALARDVVCCQDALSDVLSSVSLDLYINRACDNFVPKEQRGGTCYANASAAVLHLAMQRIVGREGGYPDFFQLRYEMIQKYGELGANTLRVLQEICPKYRLHCNEVDVIGALKAVAAKRPVLARFRLTNAEWNVFSAFYRTNPRGILTKPELRIRRPAANLEGHAVVLTSFDSQGLRLMNSWGSNWADGGFFKVSDADVLGLEFIDVYWTERDLKQSEIDSYKTHGAEIAQNLILRLKGLQEAQYKCPLCDIQSELVKFSGHALEVMCPNCRGKFPIQNPGDDLALNLYLLSLSGPERRAS